MTIKSIVLSFLCTSRSEEDLAKGIEVEHKCYTSLLPPNFKSCKNGDSPGLPSNFPYSSIVFLSISRIGKFNNKTAVATRTNKLNLASPVDKV